MSYSKEQIAYMRTLGLDFDFNNLTDDNWVAIEETVADRLMYAGFDGDENNYIPNEEGLMCESILDGLE